MTYNGSIFNITTTTNSSSDFDLFCTKMMLTPLVCSILSVLFSCLGAPASMWLLWILTNRQLTGLTNNTYMLHLTAMDLGYNLSIVPYVFNYLVCRSVTVFRICELFYYFNVCGRPLLTGCICFDSFIAVVHPITYIRIKNMRHRAFISTLVWILIVLTFIPDSPLFIVGVSISLSAPLIAYCNISVLCVLNKPDPSGHVKVHPQKRQALQIVFNSLLVAMISYPTTLIVFALSTVMISQHIFCNLFFPSCIPCTLGSFIMPLLYLRNLGSLKKVLSSHLHPK